MDDRNEILEAVESDDPPSSTFIWVIKNFARYPAGSDVIIRGTNCKMRDGNVWYMELIKNGTNLQFIISKRDAVIPVVQSVSISILDRNYSRVFEANASKLFNCNLGRRLKFTLISMTEFQKLDYEHLILYGTITVVHLDLHPCSLDVSVAPSLSDHLRKVLETQSFQDFVIKVGDRDFPCHKAILEARSEYFRSLFNCEMKEKIDGELVLKDVEPDVFEKVLEFIYTNKIEVTMKNVVGLLAVADRLLLLRLKDICEEMLNGCFNSHNAFQIFTISSAYNLSALKKRALHVLAIFGEQIRRNLDQLPHNDNCDRASSESNNDVTFASTGRSEDALHDDAKYPPCDMRQLIPNDEPFFPAVDAWCYTDNQIIFDDVWELEGLFAAIRSGAKGMEWTMTVVDKETTYTYEFKARLDNNSVSSCFSLSVSVKTNKKLTESTYVSCMIFIESTNREKNVLERSSSLHPFACDLSFHFNITEDIVKNSVSRSGELGLNFKLIFINSFAHFMTQTINLKRPNLTDYLSKLSVDNPFADLIVNVQGVEFRFNKAIVEQRWPHLLKLAVESLDNGLVTLDDVDPQTFKKLSEFVYNDTCEMVKEEVLKFFVLASKFQMKLACMACERYIISDLNLKNAIENFNIVKRLGTERIQKICKLFIVEHLGELLNLDESKDFFNDDDNITELFSR